MADPAPTTAIPVEQHVLDRVRAYLDEHDVLTLYVTQFRMAYTLGLTNASLPELVILDVSDTATALLDRIATQCAEGELEIGPAMFVADHDGEEHTLRVLPHDPAEHPDPTLARCLFGAEVEVRVLDLRSCPCSRCLGYEGDGGYLCR